MQQTPFDNKCPQESLFSKKKPLGVQLIGMTNLFILGIFSLGIALHSLVTHSKEEFLIFQDELVSRGIQLQMTFEQYRVIMVIQILLSAFFCVIGWGILKRKMWARNANILFAFFWTGCILLMAFLKPDFIPHVVFQLVYSGVVIFYFTLKKIQEYFSQSCVE